MSPRNAADVQKRAHELRIEGIAWDEVARLVGHSDAAVSQRAAKTYAVAQGLPWPMPVPPVRGPATRRTGHGSAPRPSRRGERAYELRLEGRTWVEIAALDGYGSDKLAATAARRYASSHDRPWPVHAAPPGAGERAYQLRLDGSTWRAIAEAEGFAGESGARMAARIYASKYGLPLPETVTRPETPKPRRAYDMRAGGTPWSAVATELGYPTGDVARCAARDHARRRGLSWPPTT